MDHKLLGLPKLPSNQKFGWFFGLIFILFSAKLYIESIVFLAIMFLGAALLFLTAALLAPQKLQLLNLYWYKLGLLLGKVINPFFLAIIFFLILTPVALCLRLAGRDLLRLKNKTVYTFWIDRAPSAISSDSFKNQF